jgi:hypothetical protein
LYLWHLWPRLGGRQGVSLKHRLSKALSLGFISTNSISVPLCKLGLKLPIAFDLKLVCETDRQLAAR